MQRNSSSAVGRSRATPHALAHSPEDTVAVVVVEDFKRRTDALVVVAEDDTLFTITAKPAIPIGHKLAVKDTAAGDTVIKYGQDVGKIVAPVARGERIDVDATGMLRREMTLDEAGDALMERVARNVSRAPVELRISACKMSPARYAAEVY